MTFNYTIALFTKREDEGPVYKKTKHFGIDKCYASSNDLRVNERGPQRGTREQNIGKWQRQALEPAGRSKGSGEGIYIDEIDIE